MDTHVGVPARLEGQRAHFLFTAVPQNHDWLVVAASRPDGVQYFQGIQAAPLMTDQHRVKQFVPQPGQARGDAHGFLQFHVTGAVRGERFGQPPAGSLITRDEQNSHARWQMAPRSGGQPLRSMFFSRSHTSSCPFFVAAASCRRTACRFVATATRRTSAPNWSQLGPRFL